MHKFIYFLPGLLFYFCIVQPAYPVEINGVDEVMPFIQKGRAAEYLPQYEERARKLKEAGDLRKAAETYLNASHLARATGNYQKAIVLGTKAVEVAEEAQYPVIMAKAFGHTGRAYYAIADYEKAIAYWERTASMGKEISKFIEAAGYSGLALAYRKLDQQQKSMEYLKNAGSIYETVVSELTSPDFSMTKESRRAKKQFTNSGTVRAYVSILTSQGIMHLSLQEYDLAIECFKKALYYASDEDQILEINNGMGDLHYKQGNIQNALEYHEKAVRIAEEINVPWHKMVSLSKAAMDYHRQNKFTEAIERYGRSIDLIEEQRAMLQSEEQRSSFFAQMTRTYDGMISALVSAGNTEKAFDYSERNRSRAFIDILGSKVNLSRGRASEVIAQEDELKRNIAALQLLREESDDDEVRNELRDLRREYNRFLERLRKEDLEHASLLAVEPLKLKDIQTLLPPQSVLIEFHILDDSLVVWIVRRDSMQSVVMPYGRRAIVELVKGLREGIAEVQSETSLRKAAQDLHQALLSRTGIRKGEQLIIVPHGVLHYLPFHILLQPDNRYLLEDHAISYLSSSGLMRFTSDKQKKMQGKVLAFGNPDLGNLIYNLRYAEREAREIGNLYPQSDVYLRKDATRTRVKMSLAGYGVIHFASHGEFSRNNPLESSIMLAVENGESGRLTTEDIFTLNIDASLVVLSACETAIGKVNTGDEIIGLTRAFIYAGAPSVITSLWRVNDKSTYLLMSSFYKNLKTMGKAEALRSAQRSVMKDFQHPFYWGAFILNGDPG
jgi:pentatricopeptide repeat protein